jgi:hypothetical protein
MNLVYLLVTQNVHLPFNKIDFDEGGIIGNIGIRSYLLNYGLRKNIRTI